MKKKQIIQLLCIVVLLVLAALLWYSYAKDPLGGMKQAMVEVVKDHGLEEFMGKVIEAIEKNDRRGLYKLFGSGDPMAFDRNYLKKVFKEQDFCPADVKEYRKVTRPDGVFYQAEVLSSKRAQRYLFTISENDGVFIVSSVEEN